MFEAKVIYGEPCVVIDGVIVKFTNYLAEAHELAEELNMVAGFVHEE